MIKILLFVIAMMTILGYIVMGAMALVIPLAFFIGYWAVLKPLFHFDIDWSWSD